MSPPLASGDKFLPLERRELVFEAGTDYWLTHKWEELAPPLESLNEAPLEGRGGNGELLALTAEA